MSDLETSISTNAQAPKSATADGASVTQHSLAEQIAADKYLATVSAVAKPRWGLRFAKLRPPGAV